ncbi:zinc finger MYM-type protein 3-like isoform X2 [Panulirus ornatus]|uniref:zinc finger MYM-type protein 3-like isoform X2 n=1 Tax=Panulirus ornatus TaxID=150431 RepID=UPI003A837D14
MIHRQVDEDFRDYFYCSLNCLNTREQSLGKKNNSCDVSSTTTTTNSTTVSSNNADAPVTSCNMCNAIAKAQYHMVMSDNTLRSFCRYACATKYKNTFGFQVNGMQTTDTSKSSYSLPAIRPKPTSQMTTNVTQESETATQSKKNAVNDAAQEASSGDEQTLQNSQLPPAAAELLRLLSPPTMVNKMTSCRPSTLTKGVYCRPHPWHRQTQTESSGINCNLFTSEPPPVLPVPVPVYVPSPMMMYHAPYPVPLFVPIPLPVPIFIPTTAKTSEEIKIMMKKIEEEMPSHPYEAEMLLLARASSESAESEARIEQTAENTPVTPVDETADEQGGEVSSLDNFTSYSGEVENDFSCVDVSCLSTIEEDLPRYPLRVFDDVEASSNCSSLPNDIDSQNENKGKRQISSGNSGRPRKRLRRGDSNDSQSVSDPDDPDPDPEPEPDPDPEPLLGEEFQGPYLNKMYGLAAWKSWVTGKNAELAGVSSSRSMKLFSEDILSMNCGELNYALCLFLKDVRKPSGEAYMPDTIFYLLLGIQQHLFESSRTDCIFMDFGFEKFTNSLDEIAKSFLGQLALQGLLSPGSSGVTRITETMLWECRQLGAHTPQVLLNTLFYFNTKVFKLKTVEEHYALSFVQIVKQWRRSNVGQEGSVTRTSLLKYYPKKSSEEDGKPKRNFEMHENRDDPLRCPVKLYEFYVSKCPESVRNQPNMFYVYPERSCVPDSPTWFSTQAVQPSSLSKMLHRALMVREVQEALME